MARTRTTTTVPSNNQGGLLSRLRGRREPAEVTTSEHTNPVTGTQTRKKKTKTHPRGMGHRGHGGRGPLAAGEAATASTTTTTNGHHHRAPATHQHRKPSMGDKFSGAMEKLRGNVTGKPGVQAAGTRRMHGTDGRGSHRAY